MYKLIYLFILSSPVSFLNYSDLVLLRITNIVYITAPLVSITPHFFSINDRPLIFILSESFEHSRQIDTES